MVNADATFAFAPNPARPLQRPGHSRASSFTLLNRYQQVLATYPRRWHFRISAFLLLAYVLMALAIPRTLEGRTWMLLIQLTTAIAVSASTLVEHVKEQLADARARLTPEYRAPHVVIWLAMLVLVTAVLPIATQPLTATTPMWNYAPRATVSLSPLGLVAFVSFWAAAVAWCGYFPSFYTIVPLAGVFTLLASPVIDRLMMDMLLGRASGTATGVLLFSCSMFTMLAWRLLTIDEESPDWRRAMMNWRLRAAMTGDPSLRESSTHGGSSARADARPPRLAPVEHLLRHIGHSLYREQPGMLAGAISWWRIRHYRLVTLWGWKPAALAATVMVICAVLTTLVVMNDRRPGETLQIAAGLMIFIATCIPGVIVGLIWPRRWLTSSFEVMLPTTRRQFVAESGIAMLLDLMTLWLVCQLAVFGCIEVTSVVATSSAYRFGAFSGDDLLPLAALMFSSQLLVFALLVIAMRARSALLSMLVLFPITVLPIAPALLARSLETNLPAAAIVLLAHVGFAGIAGVLALLAIRTRSLAWSLVAVTMLASTMLLPRTWLEDTAFDPLHARAATIAAFGICTLLALVLISLAYHWWCQADFE